MPDCDAQPSNLPAGADHRSRNRASTTSSDAKVAARARLSSSQAWKRHRAACGALWAATPTPDGHPPGIGAAAAVVVVLTSGLARVVVVLGVEDVAEGSAEPTVGSGCSSPAAQAARVTVSASAEAPTTKRRRLMATIQSPDRPPCAAGPATVNYASGRERPGPDGDPGWSFRSLGMTALDGIQAAATVLLGLLVVGLLKSHADILRQLHELGAGRTEEPRPVPVDLAVGSATGTRAHDMAGQTPDGEAAAVAVLGATHDTLLAFLSSGCLTCNGFWEALGKGGDLGLPAGMRVVAVTKGPGEESESSVAGLASPGQTVLMSTQAWSDYEVPGSPYFVHVNGSAGRVVGEGTAATWPQVVGLVTRAAGDRRTSRDGAHSRHNDGQGDRIDEELTAAGVLPGDPSLYPTSPPEIGDNE